MTLAARLDDQLLAGVHATLKDNCIRRMSTFAPEQLMFLGESSYNHRVSLRKLDSAPLAVLESVTRPLVRGEHFSLLPAYGLHGCSCLTVFYADKTYAQVLDKQSFT